MSGPDEEEKCQRYLSENSYKFRINYSSSYEKIVLLLTIGGMLSYIARGMFGVDLALYSGMAFGGILFLMMTLKPIPRLLQLYVVVVVVGATFLIINNGLIAGKAYLPLMLSSMGIALAISRTIKSHFRFHFYLSAFIFFGMSFYFLISFVIYRDLGAVTAGSRNHVSSMLLLNSCYYVLVRRWNGIDVSAFFPVLVLVISTLAVGISGIISAIIVFIGYFAARSKKTILLVSSCVIFLYMSLDWPSIFIGIDDDLLRKVYYKLTEKDIRADIITNYIANLDVLKFIIGVPFDELLWTLPGRNGEFIRSDNLHSSYLLLHGKIGILSFLVMFGLMLILIKLIRKDFLVFTLFFAIVLRASTDTIAFAHGFNEWPLILVLLYAVEKNGRQGIE